MCNTGCKQQYLYPPIQNQTVLQHYPYDLQRPNSNIIHDGNNSEYAMPTTMTKMACNLGGLNSTLGNKGLRRKRYYAQMSFSNEPGKRFAIASFYTKINDYVHLY